MRQVSGSMRPNVPPETTAVTIPELEVDDPTTTVEPCAITKLCELIVSAPCAAKNAEKSKGTETTASGSLVQIQRAPSCAKIGSVNATISNLSRICDGAQLQQQIPDHAFMRGHQRVHGKGPCTGIGIVIVGGIWKALQGIDELTIPRALQNLHVAGLTLG